MFIQRRWIGMRWILTLMPYFVMSAYFTDLLYSCFHFGHLARMRSVVMDVSKLFGYIYTMFDMGLVLASLILTLGTGIEEGGVILLLLGRMINRLLISLWSMLLYYIFSECQETGCLLMLLTARAQLRAKMGRPKIDAGSYHLLLLGARLCLSCMFLIWLDEDVNILFNVISVLLFISIGLGFYCKLSSYLTILALVYYDVFSNHWSMLWGWNDYFISLRYFAQCFGKIGSFLMLSDLGGGKWSMDAYLGLNEDNWDPKGSYRIIKDQTMAL